MLVSFPCRDEDLLLSVQHPSDVLLRGRACQSVRPVPRVYEGLMFCHRPLMGSHVNYSTYSASSLQRVELCLTLWKCCKESQINIHEAN